MIFVKWARFSVPRPSILALSFACSTFLTACSGSDQPLLTQRSTSAMQSSVLATTPIKKVQAAWFVFDHLLFLWWPGWIKSVGRSDDVR